MTTFFQFRYVLGVALLVALDTAVAITGGPEWVTAPLGAFALLFAPGYAMCAAAFGQTSRLPRSVLFAFCVGLSIMANILVGLLLLVTGNGLPTDALAVVDLGFVVVSVEVIIGREGVPTLWGRPASLDASVPPGSTGWRSLVSLPDFSTRQKVMAAALVVSAVVVLGVALAISFEHPHEAPTVSLGIYGPGGNSSTLPTVGVVGETLTVFVSATSNASYPQLEFLTQSYLTTGPPPTNFTPVPWNATLPLGPGIESGTSLSFPSGSTQTFNVSFDFAQKGSYVVGFSLEAPTGTPLRAVTLMVTIR